MSYGLEIVNKHGITILDNRPLPAMRVVEKTEYPSGVSIASLASDPALGVFVRPTLPNEQIFATFGPQLGVQHGVFAVEHLLQTTAGTITCVKISSADSYVLNTVSGSGNSGGNYGFAIFDTQEKPSLVFSDKFPTVAYSLSAVSATGNLNTTALTPSLPGRHKYLNIESLAVSDDGGGQPAWYDAAWPYLTFAEDGSSINVTKVRAVGTYQQYIVTINTYGTTGPYRNYRYFMVIEA